MSEPDPHWCPVCCTHHVVPSLVESHLAKGHNKRNPEEDQ